MPVLDLARLAQALDQALVRERMQVLELPVQVQAQAQLVPVLLALVLVRALVVGLVQQLAQQELVLGQALDQG